MLFLGVALVPLPGASVASEGGFYVLYDSCFGDLRAIGMLVWRLATYYLPLLAGYIAVAVDQVNRKRSGRRAKPEELPDSSEELE